MTHRLALVVDDSSTARITLKRMLEKQNINADTVDSAPSAFCQRRWNPPSYIKSSTNSD
jgi:ActR/RegA family two-component response regulator